MHNIKCNLIPHNILSTPKQTEVGNAIIVLIVVTTICSSRTTEQPKREAYMELLTSRVHAWTQKLSSTILLIDSEKKSSQAGQDICHV